MPRKTISFLYDIAESIHTDRHECNEELSKQIVFNVDDVLRHCVDRFECTEAVLLEGHNGTTNLEGLSFTNISVRRYHSNIEDNKGQKLYKDFDTSTGMTKIDNYISRYNYFYGTTTEFRSLDVDLADRFEENKIKYVAVTGVRLEKDRSGFVAYLILTFQDEPKLSDINIINRLELTSKELREVLSK